MTSPARGFSLVELLVVIAIISVLSSVAIASTTQARDKAKISRVQTDLGQIAVAIQLLYEDTRQVPNHYKLIPCVEDSETYLDNTSAGLGATDGNFPGWDGPYMNPVPIDPWGTNYYFDPDFLCGPTILGCQGLSKTVRVVESFGPNKTQNYTSGDDIVTVLCSS
jgi:prepilin-type N-terminal cleavage/methylation domain-containing protein